LVEGKSDHLPAFQGREKLEIAEHIEVVPAWLETEKIGLGEG
jgi:hypothetical protein